MRNIFPHSRFQVLGLPCSMEAQSYWVVQQAHGTQTSPKLSADPERALPVLASLLLLSVLASVVTVAVFSAIASTADSTVTAASSILARTISKWLPGIGAKLLFRLVALILIIISSIVAISETGLVFDLVLYAWSGLGTTVGPAVVYVTRTKKPKDYSVLAMLVTGLICLLAVKGSSESLVIGFVLALIVGLVLHSLVPEQNNE